MDCGKCPIQEECKKENLTGSDEFFPFRCPLTLVARLPTSLLKASGLIPSTLLYLLCCMFPALETKIEGEKVFVKHHGKWRHVRKGEKILIEINHEKKLIALLSVRRKGVEKLKLIDLKGEMRDD